MRAACLLLALGLAGLAPTARAQSLDLLGPQTGALRSALILAQLKEGEFAVDSCDARLFATGRHVLPFHRLLREDPWRASFIARSLTDQMLAQAADPTDVLFEAESRAGCEVGNAVLGDALSASRERVRACGDSALAVALSEIDGRPARYFRESGDYRLVPRAARDAAALILFQCALALRDRDRAITEPLRRLGLDPQETWELLRATATARPADEPLEDGRRPKGAPPADLARAARLESILGAVDMPTLYRGANRLAAAAKQAIADLKVARLRTPPRDFYYAVDTPRGWVKILGVGQHHHREDERNLLVIDLGGDDVYASAANTVDYANPISLVIDMEGNDEYRTELEGAPAFGAGVCGYGMLFDVAGNDVYACPAAGQGCGVLGVGLLYDAAGDDRYQGEIALQGCGVFGVGALVDLAGNDLYSCYHAAQGYGFTRGCGVLIDVQGDDRYEANDLDIRYPAALDRPHQASLAQGFGCGRDAWAGGVGILVDGAGIDHYACGVYGLGAAYAQGVGIFADKSGNDDYTTYASALGCALAGGVAIALDDAGDDVYRSGGTRACGFARDFGLAWFEDGAGNDRYYCSDSAYGVARGNGLALCWDRAGDDVYVACDNSFGLCLMDGEGTIRDLMLNAGLFADGGGNDRYFQLPLEERERLPFNFRNLSALEPLDWMANGATVSRYDLLRHPGSTGAAVDAE